MAYYIKGDSTPHKSLTSARKMAYKLCKSTGRDIMVVDEDRIYEGEASLTNNSKSCRWVPYDGGEYLLYADGKIKYWD